MKFENTYMTAQEFCANVIEVARECGYDVDRASHPEDLVANLVPVMEAYAAGYVEATRRAFQ